MNIAETENRYNILDGTRYKGPQKVLLFIAKERSSAACRAASVAVNMAKGSVAKDSAVGRVGDFRIDFVDKNTGKVVFYAVKPEVKGAAANVFGGFSLQVRLAEDDR